MGEESDPGGCWAFGVLDGEVGKVGLGFENAVRFLEATKTWASAGARTHATHGGGMRAIQGLDASEGGWEGRVNFWLAFG